MNPSSPEFIKTLEVLIHGTDLDPAKWLNFPDYGLRQYFLWKNTDNGASIAIIEFARGGCIPTKHTTPPTSSCTACKAITSTPTPGYV